MCVVQRTASTVRTVGRRRKLTPEEEANMVADYHDNNGTVKEISHRYEVSHQTVYNAVERAKAAS